MEKEINNKEEWQELNLELENLISTISSEKSKHLEKILWLENELEKSKKEIELKNETIRKNNEELKKLIDIKAENDQLKNIISELEKKLENFENTLKEKEISIVTLKSAVSDKNFEVEKIWQKLEESKQEINQLKAVLSQKDEKINLLLKELEDYKINITKLSSSIENIEIGFENKINLLKKEIKEKDKEIEEKKLQIKEYIEENKYLKSEFERKNAEFYDLKNILNSKEKQISALELKLEELENNIKLAEVKYKEPQITELKENLRKKNEIIEGLENVNKDLEAKKNALEKEKEDLLRELNAKNSQIEKMEEDFSKIEKEMNLLNAEINEYKSKNKALSLEKVNLANLLEKKEKERYDLYEENRKKESIISELTSKIKELGIKEENIRLDFEKMSKQNEKKISELFSLLEEEKKKNVVLSNNIDGLEKEKIKLKEELNNLLSEKDILSAALKERENEIESLKNNVKLLRDELKRAEEVALKNDAAAQERLSFLNKELLAEKERYIKLTSEFEKMKKSYVDIMEELDVSRNKLTILADENKKYKIEIEKLTANQDKELNEELKKEREKSLAFASNLKELQAVLGEKESLIFSLQSEKEKLEKEKENLLMNLEEIKKKYENELYAEISASRENRKAMEEKERQIKELIVGINSLKNELGQMEINYELLLSEKKNLEKHKTKEGKILSEQEMKIKKMVELMKEKDKNIAEMEEKLNKLHKEKEILEKNLAGHHAKLAEKYESVSVKNLRQEIENKDRIIAKLKESYEKISKEFADFKNDIHTRRNILPLTDFWEIIAGISHQIANSISIIKSHTQLCLDAPPNFDKTQSLSAILRSINALQEKIEEISAFSKPVVLQNKYVLLIDVLEEAIASLKNRVDCSGIIFDIKSDKKLRELKMDQVRFARALEEILLNSVEALNGKGKIEVVIKKAVEKNTQLIIISDKGPGIEENKIKDIFEPFFTTKPQKLGLGLAIAKNIIKAHGGEIDITSQYGKGTTVYIKMLEG